ncbi:hypothetical protein H4CHR_01934 [Variovorax sp. PBS-H4]|uniref:hypothetical protein n=1 Tax=Variovorax sp. PBS-H4 TaxID=434008 RepID=UPI001316F26C|nr:hypothetical protein [Variovorax sp. PBS-H4]VTU27138.1 hypothetical protein H4CHR_01934 [Variovorax sp. PBS-H4]
MSQPDFPDIKAAIDQARKLVAKAQETLGKADRFFAEQGFDEEKCLQELRRLGGEDAVQKARAEVDEQLRAIEDEVQRHKAPGKTRPVVRRVALRGGRI